MPVGAGDCVRAAGTLLGWPRLDLRNRLAEDAPLDRLSFLVELLERVGETACLVLVGGEEELERCARVPEPAGCIEARREAESDGTGVDARGIDAGDAHERAEAGFRRSRERPKPGDRKRAVLVDERDDIRDRCESDKVEVPLGNVRVDAEERLTELVDDAGSAELRERILRRPRGHDWAVGQRLGRAMVIGDDHVEAACGGFGHLGCSGDPAVHGQDEPAAFVGEPCKRAAAKAVALVEAARKVPIDVGAELAQQEDRERGRGDPVDVVVAVDANPLARGDGRSEALARGLHVAEEERIMRRLFALEETARVVGIEMAAPREHGGRDAGDAECARELRLSVRRAVRECPGAVVHRPTTLRSGADGNGPQTQPPTKLAQNFDGSFTDERARCICTPGGWGLGMGGRCLTHSDGQAPAWRLND